MSILVDGNWTIWSSWTECSSDCEDGITSRTRQCSEPLPRCGGRPCRGDNSETESCNRGISCECWYDVSTCETLFWFLSFL